MSGGIFKTRWAAALCLKSTLPRQTHAQTDDSLLQVACRGSCLWLSRLSVAPKSSYWTNLQLVWTLLPAGVFGNSCSSTNKVRARVQTLYIWHLDRVCEEPIIYPWTDFPASFNWHRFLREYSCVQYQFTRHFTAFLYIYTPRSRLTLSRTRTW